MEKSKRNKTITLDNEETQRLLSRCVFSPIRCDVQENTVVCGDCLEIAKNIQKNSIDLLIVDPPYNLTKIYGNNVFNRLSNAEYEHYTRSWIEAYLPTLKENASIYVCCDVMSGIIIAPLLSEYFKVSLEYLVGVENEVKEEDYVLSLYRDCPDERKALLLEVMRTFQN